MAKKAKWRRHTVEFKRQVVERMKTCENIGALARELKLQRKLLYTWKYQLEGRPEPSDSRKNRRSIRFCLTLPRSPIWEAALASRATRKEPAGQNSAARQYTQEALIRDAGNRGAYCNAYGRAQGTPFRERIPVTDLPQSACTHGPPFVPPPLPGESANNRRRWPSSSSLKVGRNLPLLTGSKTYSLKNSRWT
jgi:transposase-like protein